MKRENSRSRVLARRLRITQSVIFLILGGWCVLSPATVETLSLKPEYRHLSATSTLLLQCFGAQALLVGLLGLVSRFTATTFLVFGLCASLPFFVFNAWFVFVSEMFTALMLLDFAGNASFLAIGIAGWRLMQGEGRPV